MEQLEYQSHSHLLPFRPDPALTEFNSVNTGCFFLAAADVIMSPILHFTLALFLVSFTHNANAGWRMELDVLVTARMDPLISPNGTASVSSITFFRYATPDDFLAIASMFTLWWAATNLILHTLTMRSAKVIARPI